MAIKKSDLYSSLWASCDALRGGMEPSEYKDYVLFMLFIKYVSDKYAGDEDAPLKIPKGASFIDMVALKGKTDIGDKINTQIIQPLIEANSSSLSHSDFPDFNDPKKLGEDKDRQETLTKLVAIFEKPELDFSKNRAEHDDILGDAYEYLMRHFAQDSGKSKGQFYTPAEVSRIIAKLIGISHANTTRNTTAYDPTCGSGSLLLKVAAEAGKTITLYGQEISVTTAGLARMNLILHGFPDANVLSGNTLADPKYKNGANLQTFDYVVANPPFSDKAWSTGVRTEEDPYQRFSLGVPPTKQGDYAYLLHILRSLKSTGKGACILPHGVLFRGNAEAEIRKKLIATGSLKAIIGLPANLFYGTSIPACIVVLDKENAQARKGIFMIDASRGFIKDGNKNRLREQDIHRIVDIFSKAEDTEGYARMVGLDEIKKNDFNLNLPRYIDSSVAEDIQDIEGHLKGGIPAADVEALHDYWTVCPDLKAALFKPQRTGYVDLVVDKAAIKSTIYRHPQFAGFMAAMGEHFEAWRSHASEALKTDQKDGFHPKGLILQMSESLLDWYLDRPLLDAYGVYQCLMDYWSETMQDDAYQIAFDGWKVETVPVKDKKGKTKGWICDLIPKRYIVARYFAAEQRAVDVAAVAVEAALAALAEYEEENGSEDGLLSEVVEGEGDKRKVSDKAVKARIRKIADNKDDRDELAALWQWQKFSEAETVAAKKLKELEVALDKLAYEKYPKLSVDEIKTLVVDDKWLAALADAVQEQVDRVSRALTRRVHELGLRYEAPLPALVSEVTTLSAKVEDHLRKMGAWT